MPDDTIDSAARPSDRPARIAVVVAAVILGLVVVDILVAFFWPWAVAFGW